MQDLALFPLQIVVFPGERVPLHIFEERYQQLISDCEQLNLTFGIPTVINSKMSFGTEVRLKQIVKRYDSGASDVICEGLRVFQISKFFNPFNDRLYSGGEVNFYENTDDSVQSLRAKVIALIKEFYTILEVDKVSIDENSFKSFQLAHKLGFSLEQEYELLQLHYESERLLYLQNHLKTVIPVIQQINRTKNVIQLNGHFRSFDPMDFKDIEWD